MEGDGCVDFRWCKNLGALGEESGDRVRCGDGARSYSLGALGGEGGVAGGDFAGGVFVGMELRTSGICFGVALVVRFGSG